MLLLRADSVNVGVLPDNLPAYAAYVDGEFANWQALVTRFGGRAHLTSITVLGGAAQVFDLEEGNGTVEDGARWLALRLGNPARFSSRQAASLTQRAPQRHGLYFPEEWQSEVEAAIAARIPVIPRERYLLWGAHWTGLIPRALPVGLDALQCIGGAGRAFDLSIVGPSWFVPDPGAPDRGSDVEHLPDVQLGQSA